MTPNPLPAHLKAEIECRIMNTMRPTSVSKVKGNWKIGGMHFESEMKLHANGHEPFNYIEKGRRVGFACKEMRWDIGEVIKTGASHVVGEIDTESSPVSLTYPDALGAGINIKIIQDNYRWQKIIEIESLVALGKIPTDAKYLEISFKISGDLDLPDGVIDAPTPFGENSFLHPVRAWDSSPMPEDPADEVKSGAVGVIAGGVITKRIPVAWLKSAEYPVRTDTTITYGAENIFNSADTGDCSVAVLDATHFVVAYRDCGNSNYGTARVGLVSGTTIISYGAEKVFNSGDTRESSVAVLDATHFVVAYQDYTNSSYGTAIVGLVSGTTISSYGAENVFNSGDTHEISVAVLDATHILVAYQDTGNLFRGTARVGLVSGTTISSYGPESVFNSSITYDIDGAALDATHFVVAYRDCGNSNYGTARVGLVSGTTIISYGAEKVFNSGDTRESSVAVLDATHFVVAYQDYTNSSYGTAIVGLVSGTTISSYGAENVFSGDTREISVAVLDATHFVVAYQDYSNSYYGTAIVGLVSGTTISSYGAENVFSGDTREISVAVLDATHFVVAYQDYSNSYYGTAIVGLVSGTTISSYGAEYVFNSTYTCDVSVDALDATHFVVVGQDGSGFARVGSIPEAVTFIPQIIIM